MEQLIFNLKFRLTGGGNPREMRAKLIKGNGMRTGSLVRISMGSIFFLMLLGSSSIAQQESRNTRLFDAISPYEDLTECALANDASRVEKTIQPLRDSAESLRSIISEQAMKILKDNIQQIAEAEKKHDFAAIALYAVNSYRTLIDQLDEDELNVPREVAVLDFIGFNIHALLKQDTMDWKLINETVLEGNSQWTAIRKNVSESGLRDSMDTAINGLQNAADRKNIEMLRFAAEVDLDLVDLLEGYFEDRN